MKIRIAIAEDDPLTRQQYQQRFSFYENIEIVALAANGRELLEILSGMAPGRRPQLALLDIEMPELSGIETAAKIKDQFPEMEIIMLTVFKDEEKIFRSIQSGAAGYLLKDSSTARIIEAIDEVMLGGVPLSRSIARNILQYIRSDEKEAEPRTEQADKFQLTDREIEILQAIVNDETEAQMAERLFISQHTVRTHVKNIYRKLQVHSRSAVVKAALKFNLLRKKK